MIKQYFSHLDNKKDISYYKCPDCDKLLKLRGTPEYGYFIKCNCCGFISFQEGS